mmetsp:Transcript_21024/g.43309  ORF Transcript_21024/g.43309 Transcript_21024/m.43309 type:complete len:1011 (+) Transcript_21024:299-3331(+)
MFRRRSTATAKPTKNHNGFQDGPSSARAEPTSNVTSKKSRGLLLPIPTITFIRGRKDSKTKGDKRLWKKVSFRLAGAATIASKKINTSTKKYSRSGQSFNSSFNEYEEPCEDGMEYFDAEHMVFRNTCTCPNYFSDGTVGGTNLLSKGDPGNINATETCDLKELQFNIFQCYLPIAEKASMKSLSTSNHDSRTPQKNNGESEADNSSACLFRLHENESSSEDHCVLHDHSRSDTVCGHFMIWSILVAWATAEALYTRGNVCMSNGTQPDFQYEDGSSYSFEMEASEAQFEVSKGSLADNNKDEISTIQSHEDDDEVSIPSLSTELSWSNSKSPGKSQFVINDNGESNLENVVEVTISLGAFAALLGSPSSLIHRYGSEKRRRCAIQQLWDDSQDMLSLSSDEDAANENDSVPAKYYIKTQYPAHQGGLVSNEMNAGSNQIDISDSVISLSALMTLSGAPHPEAARKQLGNQNQAHYLRSLRFKNANSHPSEFDIDMISFSSEDLLSHLGTVQVEDVDDDSIPSLDLDFDPAPVGKVCLESIELLNVTATLKTPRTDDLSGSVVILNSITPTSTSPDSKWRTDESCKKGDDSSSDEMIVAGGSTRVNDTASLLQLNDNDHIRNSVNEDTASLPTLRISRDQDVVVKFPHDDNEVASIDMHCNPHIMAEADNSQNSALLGSSSLCSMSSKNAEKKNRKFPLPDLSSNDVSNGVLSLSFDEDSSIESDSEHLKGSESNQRAITDPAIAWSESTALLCTAAAESVLKPLVHQNTFTRILLKEGIDLSRCENDIDIFSLPLTDSYNFVDTVQIQEPDDDTCSIPSLDADCKPVQLQHVDDVMCNGSALPQVKSITGKDDCTRSAVKPSPVPLESPSPATKMIHNVEAYLLGHVPVAGTSEENIDDILSFSFTGNSSDETRCANSPKYIGGQNAIRIDGTSRNSHQNVMVLSMLDDESVPSLSSGSWDDDDLENSLTSYKAMSRVKSNGELSLSKVKEKDVTMSVLACGVLAAVVK